jgi:hypothetical protein
MKVIEILAAHIKAGGFDGLVQADTECGCLLDELAPCCGDFSACEPGYRGVSVDPEYSFKDWAIYRTKQAALDSVAAARDVGNAP